MMKSFTLELMDESALLTLEGEKDACFHDVCVVGDCLVQVLVLKELPATGAFCSEKEWEIVRKRCSFGASSFVEKFYKFMENWHQVYPVKEIVVCALATTRRFCFTLACDVSWRTRTSMARPSSKARPSRTTGERARCLVHFLTDT